MEPAKNDVIWGNLKISLDVIVSEQQVGLPQISHMSRAESHMWLVSPACQNIKPLFNFYIYITSHPAADISCRLLGHLKGTDRPHAVRPFFPLIRAFSPPHSCSSSCSLLHGTDKWTFLPRISQQLREIPGDRKWQGIPLLLLFHLCHSSMPMLPGAAEL